MSHKFDSGLYLQLNNYGYSVQSLADIRAYLLHQTLPESLNTAQKKRRFKQKWAQDWAIESGKLIYKPLNLTVVPDDERDSVLKKLYEDITQGVAQGITLLYKRVRDKFLNIRRSDVSAFLKAQIPYQITQPQNHIVNKPIMSSSPNDRWGIDCINMVSYASANGGVDRGSKYILTVVDSRG